MICKASKGFFVVTLFSILYFSINTQATKVYSIFLYSKMCDLTLKSLLKEEDYFDDTTNLTTPEYLLQQAKKYAAEGKIDWLVNSVTGETRKFSEFESISRKIGSGMYKRGMRKGDTFLYMTNDLFYIHLLFAGIWRANGIIRASYPEDDEDTLLERVQESNVKWILCDPETSQMCLSVRDKVDLPLEIITIGVTEQCTPISEIFNNESSELPNLEINANDPAIIFCTSGTTGKCKGAIHTHASLIQQIKSGCPFLLNDKPNFIVTKGTHTSAGLLLGCVASGKTSVVMEKITKDNLFHAVDKYKPGLIFGFPTILLLLVHDPDASKYNFSSVEVALTGGAPITPAFEQAMHKLPNLNVVINTYGLTEGVSLVSEYDLTAPKPRKYPNTPAFSIGKPFVGATIQIRDIETSEILGPNQRGEIWVKSNRMFHSYYKNPEATRNAFCDGWFKTGDMAYYDDNGYIFLVDRIKEVFKYYNNHISPTEIEDIIAKHPDVSEVCVVGIVDPDGGDRIPRAFVTLKAQTLNKMIGEELIQFTNSKLPNYKHLRGGLYIVPELPKGKTGKISRQLVLELQLLPK